MRSQVVSGASHELSHLLAHLRWVAHDVDARRLESGDLLSSASLAAGNNGASVAHAATWRCRLSSDEAHNGQIAMVVGLEPGGGLFLGLATDLANHDDALGLGVIDEALEHVDEVGAIKGVATDADNGRLTKALCGRLVDGLVCEGTGTGHDSDLALGVDVAGHNADLALAWLDNTWAVWSDKTSLILRLHDRLDLDHVEGGDALSDADDEVHLGLDSLEDGVGSEGRGHVDDGSLGISGGLGLSH